MKAANMKVKVQHLSEEVRTAHAKRKENEGMLEEMAEENKQLLARLDLKAKIKERNCGIEEKLDDRYCALVNHVKKQCWETTQPSMSTDGAANQNAYWHHLLASLLEIQMEMRYQATMHGATNQVQQFLSDLLGIHYGLSTI